LKILVLATLVSACPALALAAGNSLAMTGSGYDFTTSKFPNGALSGGFGTVALTQAASSSYTWEAWVKLSAAPGQPIVAIGSGTSGFLGANAQGQEVCNVYNGTTYITGPSITDGNWHLIDLVGTPSGFSCYLDGNVVGTSTVVQTVAANPTFGVGTMGLFTGANVWTGEIDEASMWSVARYSGAFTPPAAPYKGNETGLTALWHFSGNGVDSANDTVLAANDPSILYSPFNWTAGNGASTTINAGAYLRTMFTGSTCSMNFDLSTSIAPASEIYWRVDGYEAGTPWVRTVPGANVACTPSSDLSAAPWHMLEMVVKSTSETINRWNTAQAGTAVRFAGLSLAPGASGQRPFPAPWSILLLGDSITEGVRTVNQTATNDTDRNDATLGWAFRLGNLLGAEVGVVGFGGTGLTVGGSGGVPALTTSYNLVSSGQPRAPAAPPNLIVINEGTNDTANVTAAAVAVLNGLIAQYPDTPIAVLVPFNGSHAADLALAAQTCNRPGVVHLVPTNGVVNPANGIDSLGLHPTGPNNLGMIAPRLASMLAPILLGGPSGLGAARIARIP
jgi:lysophospholipase L1-like esterase